MQYLPIFLDVHDRPVLVVGGGAVAARKVETLLEAGAKVRLVSPELHSDLQAVVAAGEIEWIAQPFSADQIGNPILIYAATNNAVVNQEIAAAAQTHNIPVNVVDAPDTGSFITPSVIDRSPILAAVATGGSSPVLTRLIRARLESLIPAGYGRLAEFAAKFRKRVQERLPAERRAGFWEKVLEGRVAELVFSGRMDEAERTVEQALEEASDHLLARGEVYLVGGGPGDPDLLTFRALRLMQRAEVVVYDRLISKAVLNLCRKEAEFIYVGKERDRHTVPQDQINQLLADKAKEGKRVLRLKGGDPFVFGRGGEEIETLMEQGVPFQVVPGITAAVGIASYAGIPLTHRDYAQSVVFATGHLKDNTCDLNWDALAAKNQTVVFYMGLKGLSIIAQYLISHGRDPSTPAALVQKGTTPEQRVFTGTLATLPSIVEREEIKAPTLIIVGEVVALHEKLNWFQPEFSRPGDLRPF